MIEIHLGKIGQETVLRRKHAHLLELELVDNIVSPFAAKRIEAEHINRSFPQQVPEGHLDGPGIGGGDDSHKIIVGQGEQLFCFLDRFF